MSIEIPSGTWVARDSGDNGTIPRAARQAIAGLVSGGTGGGLGARAGVIPDGNGPFVSGTAGWAYQVRPLVAVVRTTAVNGAVVIAVPEVIEVPTDPAPGANSRWDRIWIRQLHVAGDGGSATDVTGEVGVTQGAAAGSPNLPALPNGATEIARALVTAGSPDTSGVGITQTDIHSVSRGGVLPVTTAQRNALPAYPGMVVFNTQVQELQCFDGTRWGSYIAHTSGVPDEVNSVMTQMSGWNVSSSRGYLHGATAMVMCTFTRTGGNIGVPSGTGNITNQHIATLSDPRFLPVVRVPVTSHATGRVATGWIGPSGEVNLAAVGGSVNIETGESLSLITAAYLTQE